MRHSSTISGPPKPGMTANKRNQFSRGVETEASDLFPPTSGANLVHWDDNRDMMD